MVMPFSFVHLLAGTSGHLFRAAYSHFPHSSLYFGSKLYVLIKMCLYMHMRYLLYILMPFKTPTVLLLMY